MFMSTSQFYTVEPSSEQWTRWGLVFCKLFGGSSEVLYNMHTVVGRGHTVCPL